MRNIIWALHTNMAKALPRSRRGGALVRMAAEQGNARAQYNLGYAYDKGKGVVKDQREAVRWYRMAAKQGDADAQFNLGCIRQLGEGVTKDQRRGGALVSHGG